MGDPSASVAGPAGHGAWGILYRHSIIDGGGRGGRGGFKGKSGILFKARDYIHWLEQGRDALLAEVMRVEAAAGIR